MNRRVEKEGIVYLVGAGPGNPELITVRARRLLDRCDAVVYDNLIPDELLVTLPLEVDRRYVGKKTSRHSLPQDEINDLLVRLASQGKQVVRLKGGDPFVFGRGSEEALYLKEHGIPFEIVPGITSGVAALSYTGIPCTDRSDASYVIFLTGHQAIEKATSGVPWEWVGGAQKGTLVIYMGVGEIGNIAKALIGAGMSPDRPVAAVERGTLPTQRTVTSTLSEIAGAVVENRIRPPALFVVGDVVRYHKALHWFTEKPLFGVRVMATRPADQAVQLYHDLRELGAEVLAYPTLATREDFRSDNWDAIRKIGTDRRYIVFTNDNGVRYFLNQWYATIGDIRELSRYKLVALGDGTARALNAVNLSPDFVPTLGTTAALAEQMVKKLDLEGASVIRVRGNLYSEEFDASLIAAGVDLISLPVYRTFHTEWSSAVKEKLFTYPPDAILFSSGAAVNGLESNLGADRLHELCGGAAIASIGPSATKQIEAKGLTVALESEGRTLPSLLQELVALHRARPIVRA